MSLESNVGREFLNVMDVLKTALLTEVASSSGDLQLTEEQLVGLKRLVTATVDKTGQQTVDALTKLVR